MPPIVTFGAQLPGAESDNDLPVLYGIQFDGSRLAVDVASFGCTDASYFAVQIAARSAEIFQLRVVAQKRDMCRMRAHIVTLSLDIPAEAKATGAKFLVMNKFAAPGELPRP